MVSDVALQPLVDFLNPYISQLKLLVGGIFGLYLILIIARVYYERKKVKILDDIRFNVEQQNINLGLMTSSHRKKFIKRTKEKISNIWHTKIKK